MRRLVFLSSGALALVVGCGLVGTYDYDAYEGIPVESSSSSSGNGGMGGVGGMGGLGGMTPECPPDGGMITPDLCDNDVDEDCSGGDCSVKAAWSNRYGNGEPQTPYALSITPEGGVALAGELGGELLIGGTGIAASPGNLEPFAARVDVNGTASFAHRVARTGSFNGITTQGDETYVVGTIKDLSDTSKNNVLIQKLTAKSDKTADLVWEIVFGKGKEVHGGGIGTTNAKGSPIVVTGHFDEAIAFPQACPGAPASTPTTKHAFLMSFDPTTNLCLRGTAIENATITAIHVTGDTVALAGYSTQKLALPDAPTPTSTASFVLRYHPATHTLQSSSFFNPTSGVISLFAITEDARGRIYAAGTFQGTFSYNNNMSLMSSNGGADFDSIVIAFDPKTPNEVSWAATFGGTGLQLPTAIAAAGDGIYITGMTSFGMAIESGANSGPICTDASCNFLLKLHPSDGKTLWGKAFGGGESQMSPRIRLASTPTDLWLSSGWTTDIDFGSKPMPGAGGTDVVLARFSPLP